MKKLQLPAETTKALLDGASSFVLPIELNLNSFRFDGFSDEFDERIEPIFYDKEADDYIKIAPPLQVDDEFYLQETFNLNGECWGVANPVKINYKIDGKSNYDWIQVNRCREEYSRYKAKVLNIEAKRVQDISHDEVLSIYPDAHTDKYDNFMHGFNDKFCDGKYEENPYVFLITVERID